jgi:hypothetical protein
MTGLPTGLSIRRCGAPPKESHVMRLGAGEGMSYQNWPVDFKIGQYRGNIVAEPVSRIITAVRLRCASAKSTAGYAIDMKVPNQLRCERVIFMGIEHHTRQEHQWAPGVAPIQNLQFYVVLDCHEVHCMRAGVHCFAGFPSAGWLGA